MLDTFLAHRLREAITVFPKHLNHAIYNGGTHILVPNHYLYYPAFVSIGSHELNFEHNHWRVFIGFGLKLEGITNKVSFP